MARYRIEREVEGYWVQKRRWYGWGVVAGSLCRDKPEAERLVKQLKSEESI